VEGLDYGVLGCVGDGGGSHDSDCEDYCFLSCAPLWCARNLLMFQMNMWPLSTL
jgi:hypothetical protein